MNSPFIYAAKLAKSLKATKDAAKKKEKERLILRVLVAGLSGK